jgi:hypothetical protein
VSDVGFAADHLSRGRITLGVSHTVTRQPVARLRVTRSAQVLVRCHDNPQRCGFLGGFDDLGNLNSPSDSFKMF